MALIRVVREKVVPSGLLEKMQSLGAIRIYLVIYCRFIIIFGCDAAVQPPRSHDSFPAYLPAAAVGAVIAMDSPPKFVGLGSYLEA